MGFWRSSYVRIGQSSARSSAILYVRHSRRPDGPASTLHMTRVSRLACDPRCYRLPPHKPLLSREALALWMGLQLLRQVADIWRLRHADNQPNPCGAQLPNPEDAGGHSTTAGPFDPARPTIKAALEREDDNEGRGAYKPP